MAESDAPPRASGQQASARPARQDATAGASGADGLVGSFDRDTAVVPRAGTRREDQALFSAQLVPAWRAMRGPHGGYLAAVVLRALTQAAADPARAPRSLTVHYARPPQAGEVLIRTALERQGRSLSTLSARMEQDGSLVLLALAAFSVPWSAPEVIELPPPEVAGPDQQRSSPPELLERIEQGLAPSFLGQLVIQPRGWAMPFNSSDGPMEVGSWLGLREPQRPLDALALAMLSDVGAPPPLLRLPEPALASTVDLTVHFRTRTPRPEADPAQLNYARLRTRLVHEGFFESDGVIWGHDGAVLAQSRQLAVLMPARASGD